MSDIDLNLVFTLEELKRMKAISDREPSEKVARVIVEEVIGPVIRRIEKEVGEEIDETFLAYACIYLRPWPDSKP